jgi:hypothetical protein
MKLQRITSARDSWPNRNPHEIKLEGGYIFCHQLSSESVFNYTYAGKAKSKDTILQISNEKVGIIKALPLNPYPFMFLVSNIYVIN